MKIISHRANLNGPKNSENTLTQIDLALRYFDVEIDIWLLNGDLFLGHDLDKNLIKIDDRFLIERKSNLWIHTKNIAGACYFSKYNSISEQKFNWFYHENDPVTLTSNNYLWTYPGNHLTERSISVIPELLDKFWYKKHIDCFAICTDYPHLYEF